MRFNKYILCLTGEVERLQLEHDNSGSSPDWFVELVSVEDIVTGKSWSFNYNNWISLTKGSMSLREELKLS